MRNSVSSWQDQDLCMQPDQQGLSAAWDELTEQSHGQHHTALGLEVCGG